MGKSKDTNKGEAPNPTSVANRDILQRLNYLYQASVLLNGLAPGVVHQANNPSISHTTSNDTNMGAVGEHPPSHHQRPKKKKRRRVVGFGELSRSYIETMKIVGQKTNVRMDPSVKRRICKHCCTPLIPGVSAAVRIADSASHGHVISYQCHCCQTTRRIPAPPVLHVDPSTNEDAMEAQVSATPMPTVTTRTGTSARSARQQKKKKGPKPRLPPHFARDVGHVVFRGNELVDATRSMS